MIKNERNVHTYICYINRKVEEGMKQIKIAANLRKTTGKGSSHRTRYNGKIPGVIYGKGFDNLFVEFSDMDIDHIVKNYGENAVVDIELNGSKIKTIIKEVQRDPIKNHVAHIDMKYINDGEVVHTNIPVLLEGGDNIRKKGGIVQKQVGAIPDNMPKYLVADISGLNIGDKLKVSDIEASSEIALDINPETVIALITTFNQES